MTGTHCPCPAVAGHGHHFWGTERGSQQPGVAAAHSGLGRTGLAAGDPGGFIVAEGFA